MKRGTIVLTPFPFTDLTGSKVRPAVVISRSDRTDNDVILAFMTSRHVLDAETELLVDAKMADFPKTGLKSSGVIRLSKLATIDASMLLGELGELSPTLIDEMNKRLRYSLDL